MTQPPLPIQPDLIERVARAIGPEIHSQLGRWKIDGSKPNWDSIWPEAQQLYRELAQAAIEAAGVATLQAQLDRVTEALFMPIESDASYNLQGALEDLRGPHDPNDGGVCAGTIERVIEQIEQVRALSHRGGE